MYSLKDQIINIYGFVGGQAWPLLQIFLTLFFLSFKNIKIKKNKNIKIQNYALKKVNAIPNSWAIVRLLQL